MQMEELRRRNTERATQLRDAEAAAEAARKEATRVVIPSFATFLRVGSALCIVWHACHHGPLLFWPSSSTYTCVFLQDFCSL